jgi:anti-sigma28 factor (negative regulator of flagellin synthesis)
VSIDPVPSESRNEPISMEAKRGARSRNRSKSAPTRRNRGAPDAGNVSLGGRELTRFETAAARAAERDRLVKRLKSAVDGGSYRPDPEAIAEAMGRRSDA